MKRFGDLRGDEARQYLNIVISMTWKIYIFKQAWTQQLYIDLLEMQMMSHCVPLKDDNRNKQQINFKCGLDILSR